MRGEQGAILSTVVDLKTIIEDTLVMLSGSIQKRNIQVKLNTPEKIPPVSGDRTRLIRVFMNIVKNIYEAFDEAEAAENKKLEISIVHDMEKEEIKVAFLDNASGFSPEIAEKLFERGYTTKQNGSGIGLHECRAVIKSHGGTMTIESKGKNAGALTIVSLPIPATKKG